MPPLRLFRRRGTPVPLSPEKPRCVARGRPESRGIPGVRPDMAGFPPFPPESRPPSRGGLGAAVVFDMEPAGGATTVLAPPRRPPAFHRHKPPPRIFRLQLALMELGRGPGMPDRRGRHRLFIHIRRNHYPLDAIQHQPIFPFLPKVITAAFRPFPPLSVHNYPRARFALLI